MATSTVFPGDTLGPSSRFTAGLGTYVRDGTVRASICGVRHVLPAAAGGEGTLVVRRGGDEGEGVATIAVGSTVLCKVLRLTKLAAHVEILVAEGRPLASPFSGIIRKENVRTGEVDSVRMEEAFAPGDLVQAAVASLGDSRSYFLTTAAAELGVVAAKGEAGETLTAVSYDKMADGAGNTEKRKVARPQGGA
jgi:exosome complex component CSL4